MSFTNGRGRAAPPALGRVAGGSFRKMFSVEPVPDDARERSRVAVVGAGIAGLACARALLEHGVDVVSFDKGRAPGGRLATPRSTELEVDLGAQYFTARDPRFQRFVRAWIEDGVVARWDGRIRALPSHGGPPIDTAPLERFVGRPSMSAIARPLGRDVRVRAGHRVDAVSRLGARYVLSGSIGAPGVSLGPRDLEAESPLAPFGEFDVVAVCLPPEQAAVLLRDLSPELSAAASRVVCEPCLALGFAPEGDALSGVPFDGLFVGRDGDPHRTLAWLARDSSKPGRAGGERWVVQAAPEWSRLHLRAASEEVEQTLLAELGRVLALGPLRAKATALRRWALARAPAPLSAGALFDDEAKLGLAGDWCAGGRVEGAFLSGLALAERVLGLPPRTTLDP